MVEIKYNLSLNEKIIENSLSRLINQTYKLLPLREEGGNWTKPLTTISEELAGMNRLLPGQQEDLFFSLLCKLEGLHTLVRDEDFDTYRGVIFNCLNLLTTMKDYYVN